MKIGTFDFSGVAVETNLFLRVIFWPKKPTAIPGVQICEKGTILI